MNDSRSCCKMRAGRAGAGRNAVLEGSPSPGSLKPLAEQLAGYISNENLDHDALSTHDVLDALASLGLTLVEDQIGASALTYQEALSAPDDE